MELRKNQWSVPVKAISALLGALSLGSVSQTALASPVQSPPVFDWQKVNNSGNAAYTPAPVLTDASVANVMDVLNSQPSGAPLAVKIIGPISPTTAAAIFDHYKLSYVFADFESSNAVSQTAALVAQIKAGASESKSAFVGEFNMYNVSNDGTRVGTSPTTGSFGNTPFTATDSRNAGITMANEAAYPGSPDFSSTPNSQNPFPNLRSAFFVLPIDRVTFATDLTALGTYPSTTPVLKPGGFQNIPWVARFNNAGNNTLNDGSDLDGYKYVFNTNDANHPNWKNQLLSAGDFSAQMLQYRLRGATSYNLFNYSNTVTGNNSNQQSSSVIGYSVSQEATDALNGFDGNTGSGHSQNSTLAAIWGRNNYAYANLLNNVPTSPNKLTSAIASGMVLSGIYDVSGSTRQLALMLSNMSPSAKQVDFWQKYGGASVDLNTSGAGLQEYYTIQPGTHQLLQFNLVGGKWVLFENDQVFADSNRNGVGVPEPASIGLLGIAGGGLLLRRRRRTAQ